MRCFFLLNKSQFEEIYHTQSLESSWLDVALTKAGEPNKNAEAEYAEKEMQISLKLFSKLEHLEQVCLLFDWCTNTHTLSTVDYLPAVFKKAPRFPFILR